MKLPKIKDELYLSVSIYGITKRQENLRGTSHTNTHFLQLN